MRGGLLRLVFPPNFVLTSELRFSRPKEGGSASRLSHSFMYEWESKRGEAVVKVYNRIVTRFVIDQKEETILLHIKTYPSPNEVTPPLPSRA